MKMFVQPDVYVRPPRDQYRTDEVFDKRPIKRVDLPEIYMAKAIRMLRTYLTQCQTLDQQCLLDLFFLCSFETYAKNYQGAQIYLGQCFT
jgi:hypothetical protein